MPSRLEIPATLYVDDSTMPGAGRGVFAQVPLAAGSLIEQCPVVALYDKKDRARLRKTGLVNYYFLWGEKRDHAAICLGWGAVYNHSFTPNARFEKVIEDGRMDFYALRDIKPGEEILVNYNGTPDDMRPIRMPGIPVEAGGMSLAGAARIADGLKRRARILSAWFTGKPANYLFFLAAIPA